MKMIVRIICLIFLSLPILSSYGQKNGKVQLYELVVAAPFVMPAINVPDFSKCPKMSIVEYGAVQGDKVKTSAAIQSAIAKANKLGGGVVVIPAGEWLTKGIRLKSVSCD